MAKKLRAKRQEKGRKLILNCLTFDISEENFKGLQGENPL